MMKKSIGALACAVLSAAAWALPTTQEVETAIQQGHYGEAEPWRERVPRV
jgi:hypothetical protein